MIRAVIRPPFAANHWPLSDIHDIIQLMEVAMVQCLRRFSSLRPLLLSPSAQQLHKGSEMFEEVRAYQRANKLKRQTTSYYNQLVNEILATQDVMRFQQLITSLGMLHPHQYEQWSQT